MWYMHKGMGWWMIFGGFRMILLWGAVIALIVWGIKKITGGRPGHNDIKPLDIARERYARGELSHEEYERVKETITR